MRVDFLELHGHAAGIGLDNAPRARSRIIVTTQPPTAFPGLLSLTDGQRDCLRLVYNHMTSKDIARRLRVSPHTVDMRLRTAMKTLGVASRIEAARLLVQEESGGQTTPDAYQPLIYQASELAEPSALAKMKSPGSNEYPADATTALRPDQQPEIHDSPVVDPPVNGPPRLADASVNAEALLQTKVADAGSFDPGVGIRPSVLPKPWGARNDLAIGARLSWIFLIAVGSTLAFGAVLSAMAALKTLT